MPPLGDISIAACAADEAGDAAHESALATGRVEATNWQPWVVAAMLLVAGGLLLHRTWQSVATQWKRVLLATTRGGSP